VYSDVKLFISGKWRDGFKSTSREVVNPSTQAVIGQVACAEASDLDEAIHSAKIGFEAWRDTSAFHRYGVLKKAADLIRERAKSIAELLTLEQGKRPGASCPEQGHRAARSSPSDQRQHRRRQRR
jgi:succinate-semialdehyde dehydrogenase/glutarate-semialdehyde dehydrogenase